MITLFIVLNVCRDVPIPPEPIRRALAVLEGFFLGALVLLVMRI